MRNNMAEMVALELAPGGSQQHEHLLDDNLKFISSDLNQLIDESPGGQDELSFGFYGACTVRDSPPPASVPDSYNSDQQSSTESTEEWAGKFFQPPPINPKCTPSTRDCAFINEGPAIFVGAPVPALLQAVRSYDSSSTENSQRLLEKITMTEPPRVLNSFEQYLNPSRSANNFHKKYPRRSQKQFAVVPKVNVNENWNESVDLKALNIGPRELYFSEQKKILNKLQAALETLSILVNQRQDIELHIFGMPVPDRQFEATFGPVRSTCYQFEQHIACIIKIAQNEHAMVIVVFKKLEPFAANNDANFEAQGEVVLAEMSDAIMGLVKLKDFQVIRSNGVLDVSLHQNEVKAIGKTLDAFVVSVKTVASELWALQNIVKQYLKN